MNADVGLVTSPEEQVNHVSTNVIGAESEQVRSDNNNIEEVISIHANIVDANDKGTNFVEMKSEKTKVEEIKSEESEEGT